MLEAIIIPRIYTAAERNVSWNDKGFTTHPRSSSVTLEFHSSLSGTASRLVVVYSSKLHIRHVYESPNHIHSLYKSPYKY